MNELIKILSIYLLGGVTFIPILMLAIYFSTPSSKLQKCDENAHKADVKNAYIQQGKKGWIRLTKKYKRKGSESNVAVLLSGIQSYVQGSKRQKEHVFAELKCSALFIYQDQQQEECRIIIPIHNYNISIYSEKENCQDNEIFGKSTAIKLTPKTELSETNEQVLLEQENQQNSLTTKDELYITCARPVDKEDWYFGLLAATQMMTESPDKAHIEMVDITHFDPSAMENLISTVQQDADYREVQWLNAILGRLFLSLYKTNEIKQLFQSKISKKAQKVKLPSYLGEIVVQSVDIGHSIPYITQPKLLSLTPEGDLLAEAFIDYAGGLRVVIQTDLIWNYSSLMKPIRVPLVLSVMLKKLSGKVVLKVKPPPTNRCWFGFYELPVMDWEISPVVSDKQIRLSVVTNAIQSKIREFMVENLVLPNMEDFPFCPSDGLGGIFGERIPKPSTPKASPVISRRESSIQYDLLGNKVNKKAIPPKVINTQQIDQATDDLSSMAGSRLRGYSTPSVHPLDKSTNLVDRSLSIPNIVGSVTSEFISSSPEEEKTESLPLDNPEATSTSISVSNYSSIRQRHQASPDDTNQITTHGSSTSASTPELEHSDQSSIETNQDMPDILNKSTNKASINTILSKPANINKSTKLNINTLQKKNALYNMAGNLFNKRKSVTKEVKEERNRELLESHNRKMMNLFVNQESKVSPPPLPPRKSQTSDQRYPSSESSISTEGNLSPSSSSTASSSSTTDAVNNKFPTNNLDGLQKDDILTINDLEQDVLINSPSSS